VDGGFVSPRKLEAIKRGYASILGVGMADVNYQYRKAPGRVVHTLKYVTRPTFRNYDWDIEMALELRGFRNMVVWGRNLWEGMLAWSLEELNSVREVKNMDVKAIDSLSSKVCPVCGKPIKWQPVLPIALLDMVEKQHLGAGYWRLPDSVPRTKMVEIALTPLTKYHYR
jgi:hypothetical protein